MTDKNIQDELNDLADKIRIRDGEKKDNDDTDAMAVTASNPQANRVPNLDPREECELVQREFWRSLREHIFRKGMEEALECLIGLLDMGFDELHDKIINDERSSCGNDRLMIIPGSGGTCSKNLFAIAKGQGNSWGFDSILRSMITSLIKCDHILENVVLLSDVWDSETFEKYYAQFQGFAHKQPLPKKFIFITTGKAKRLMTVVPVVF